MIRRRLNWYGLMWLVAGGGGLVACGGQASGPPSPALPAALVLRVDAVEVSSTRQGSQLAWDADEPQTDPGAGCKVLVAGASFFVPAMGPASTLCGLASASHQERHAQDPDLQVRLGVGVDAAYASWVARDTSSQSFRYEFVVPVAAVPADGLRLEVLDDDGFVAAHAGTLRVGLNDEDLSNNEGQVSYEVGRRAPTAEEWLAAGRQR